MNDLKFLFVGGTGRSGTTIIGKVINESDQVTSCDQELRLITDPGGLLDLYNDLSIPDFARNDHGLREFEKLFNQVISGNIFWAILRAILSKFGVASLRYRNLRFTARVRSELKQLFNDFYSELGVERVIGVWYGSPSFRRSKIYYARLEEPTEIKLVIEKFLKNFFMITSSKAQSDIKYLLDDSPTTVLHYKSLSKLLTNSQFIIVDRNTCDVSRSFNEATWGGRKTPMEVEKFVVKIKQFLINNVSGENVHVVDYDKIVDLDNQANEILNLEKFLGLVIPKVGKEKIKLKNANNNS